MITKIPYKDHEEWLSIRKNYIGGSDAGAVIGLNAYSSPYELWAQKTGKVPPFEGNTITEVGSFLEEFVAQQFCKITGKQVRKSNFTYVNDKYPWACANVDRLVVGEDSILEIKTTGNYEYIKQIRNGEPVPTWWCQITHYMAVLEKKKAYLAVLLDCREVKVLEFNADEGEEAALMAAERDFWEYVKNDTPPAPDGTEATTEALKTIYGSEEAAGRIDLFGREALFDERKALVEQIAALTARKDEIENIIKNDMGSFAEAACGKFSVSWKTSKGRKTFSVQGLANDHPEIDISQYYETGNPYRIFKIKEVK